MVEVATGEGERGFRAGVRLFGVAARRAFRMRNVWILLALCAVGEVGAWVGEARAIPAFIGVTKLAPKESARRVAASMARRWREPTALAGNLVHGVQRPLNASFSAAHTPVMQAAYRVFGLEWDPLEPPTGAPLLVTIALANLIYAALTAGVLGWVRAALRGDRQDGRTFARAATHGVSTIYVWLLILDALSLVTYGLTAHRSVAAAGAVGSAMALVLLPLLFLPFRAVAKRESIGPAAPGSVRLAVSQVTMLAGFLVCYRVAAELAFWLATTLQVSLPMPNGPAAAMPFGVLAGGFAGAMVRSAVALVLCVGLMLMVEESILLRSHCTSYAGPSGGEESERPTALATDERG